MLLVPQAATNWTMGLSRGLTPANWTVSDGNNTGIKCDSLATPPRETWARFTKSLFPILHLLILHFYLLILHFYLSLHVRKLFAIRSATSFKRSRLY